MSQWHEQIKQKLGLQQRVLRPIYTAFPLSSLVFGWRPNRNSGAKIVKGERTGKRKRKFSVAIAEPPPILLKDSARRNADEKRQKKRVGCEPTPWMLNDTRFDHTHNPFGVAVVALRVVFLVEAVAKEHRDALIQVGLE